MNFGTHPIMSSIFIVKASLEQHDPILFLYIPPIYFLFTFYILHLMHTFR